MQQPFESFIEAQQKMVDFWSEQMKKMTESTLPQGYEPFQQWIQMQQEFMNKLAAGVAATDWMKDAPGQMSKWMELQGEMGRMWTETLQKTAKEMGANLPDIQPFQESGKMWSDWLAQSQQLMKEKDPVLWFPFYQQYAEVYSTLYGYWEPFTQMIREGIYDERVIEKYYSQEAYRELIGKMMNFGPTDRASELLNKSNQVLEHFIEYSNEIAPTLENTMTFWDKTLNKYTPKGMNPMFDILSDVNRYVREILDPIYTIASPQKEVRMMQLMRDVQFNYLSFHVKAAELQGMILEVSQLALPDALEETNERFREKKEMPEFKDFFLTFIDKLEKRVSEVLASDRYTHLQNEVAKTGVTVKSRLDEMVEWSLQGLPIVTKSEEDDIAKELHALREKVRHLEEAMTELKKQKGKKVPA